MKRHVLKRSGERPLAFTGELLFSDATSPDRGHPNYSGSVGRWTEVKLYQTDKGKYVLGIARYTLHQGEEDSYRALVFDRAEDVVDYLEKNGPYWVVAPLSEKLGVVEEV